MQASRVAQLAERLGLDLADALAVDVEHLADVLERVTESVGEAEAEGDNLAFPVGDRLEDRVDSLKDVHDISDVARRAWERLVALEGFLGLLLALERMTDYRGCNDTALACEKPAAVVNTAGALHAGGAGFEVADGMCNGAAASVVHGVWFDWLLRRECFVSFK